MRRITLWLTGTLVVTAFLVAYQVSLSGDGKAGGSRNDFESGLGCGEVARNENKQDGGTNDSADSDKAEEETHDGGPPSQPCTPTPMTRSSASAESTPLTTAADAPSTTGVNEDKPTAAPGATEKSDDPDKPPQSENGVRPTKES